jgi:hypothetical protein
MPQQSSTPVKLAPGRDQDLIWFRGPRRFFQSWDRAEWKIKRIAYGDFRCGDANHRSERGDRYRFSASSRHD